jgi:hypothetical protein
MESGTIPPAIGLSNADAEANGDLDEEVDEEDEAVVTAADTRTVCNGLRKGPKDRVALRSMPSPQVALNNNRTCVYHEYLRKSCL